MLLALTFQEETQMGEGTTFWQRGLMRTQAMAPQNGGLAVLVEDLSPLPSIHVMAHNSSSRVHDKQVSTDTFSPHTDMKAKTLIYKK